MRKNKKDIFPRIYTFDVFKKILIWFILGIVLLQIPQALKYTHCVNSNISHCSTKISSYNFVLSFTLPLIVLIIIKFKDKYKWSDLGLNKPKVNNKELVKYLLLGIIVIFVVNLFVQLLAKKINILGEQQFNLSKDNKTLIFFGIFAVLFAPLIEETLFRGFEFSIIGRNWGVLLGAILSSITFGLAHGQLNAFIVTSIFGLYLCFLYVKTKSLIPGIFLHAINNSIALISIIISLK